MCSYAFRPLLNGRSANVTVLVRAIGEAASTRPFIGESVDCSRLTRLAGGPVSIDDLDNEDRCDRDDCGICMPRACKEMDFRLVLYCILYIVVVKERTGA